MHAYHIQYMQELRYISTRCISTDVPLQCIIMMPATPVCCLKCHSAASCRPLHLEGIWSLLTEVALRKTDCLVRANRKKMWEDLFCLSLFSILKWMCFQPLWKFPKEVWWLKTWSLCVCYTEKAFFNFFFFFTPNCCFWKEVSKKCFNLCCKFDKSTSMKGARTYFVIIQVYVRISHELCYSERTTSIFLLGSVNVQNVGKTQHKQMDFSAEYCCY